MNSRVPQLELMRSLLSLMLAMAIVGMGQVKAQISSSKRNSESPSVTKQSRFYCNTKALSPADRSRHAELTKKLVATRKEIAETEKGYEFQFSPSTVSLGELAEWVANESKCCPFFDFHLDLEREGSLLCLRLTGEEGIKAFIRAEFQVP